MNAPVKDEATKNLFKVGDIVRVANLPGPRMLVTDINPGKKPGDPATVGVLWFDRRANVCTDVFPPGFLAKAAAWEDRPRTGAEFSRDMQGERGDAAD